MSDSSPLPFLQARLSAIALRALNNELLGLHSASRLHLISKTAGDIERSGDTASASYQEMLFGVATLQSELERHAQRRSSEKEALFNLDRSLGFRSLFLAACAYPAEFET